MELELKHLLVYQPYGLKVRYTNKWNRTQTVCLVGTMDHLNKGKGIQVEVSNNNLIHFYSRIKGIKPILKPKSFLQQLQDEIYIRWGGGISKAAKEYWIKDFIENLMYTAYPALKFDEIEFMAENHIDIFGLIEKGLAVNIKTITE